MRKVTLTAGVLRIERGVWVVRPERMQGDVAVVGEEAVRGGEGVLQVRVTGVVIENVDVWDSVAAGRVIFKGTGESPSVEERRAPKAAPVWGVVVGAQEWGRRRRRITMSAGILQRAGMVWRREADGEKSGSRGRD